MGGESVWSCPPNVFSLADEANIVVEPWVSLVLKRKLCMLMILFKEFSDFMHSRSARIELITPTTDAQRVCLCLSLHDLMPCYIFARKGMQCLSGSLNSHSILYITADSCLQVYSHHQPALYSGHYKHLRNYTSWVSLWLLCPSWSCLSCLEMVWQPPVTEPAHLESCLSQLRCLWAVWVHLHCSSAEQASLNTQTLTAESCIWSHPALRVAAEGVLGQCFCLGLSSSEQHEHTTALKAHTDPPWNLFITVTQIVKPQKIAITNPRWALWGVGHDGQLSSRYESVWCS